MKTVRVSLMAIAVAAMATACVHPQAQPAPTPTPMPPVPAATPPVVSLATPESMPTPIEITPAPEIIQTLPAPRPRSHPAPRRSYVRRPVGGRIYGTRYRVRPGDNLWEIARRAYGNPWRWHHVFHANRSHIRNPRLIYPGQVLHLPRHRR